MSNFKIKSLTLLLVGCASPKDGSGTTSPLSSVAGDTTSAQVGALDSAAGADSAEDASETSGVTSENWPVMQAAA